MDVPQQHLRIGRVLHEDDAFVTLEVPKDHDRSLRLEDGDRFLSFIFVRQSEDGAVQSWLPWQDD